MKATHVIRILAHAASHIRWQNCNNSLVIIDSKSSGLCSRSSICLMYHIATCHRITGKFMFEVTLESHLVQPLIHNFLCHLLQKEQSQRQSGSEVVSAFVCSGEISSPAAMFGSRLVGGGLVLLQELVVFKKATAHTLLCE